MISDAWMFLASLTVLVGFILTIGDQHFRRFFALVPPIVVIYIVVTMLAGIGFWQNNESISNSQTSALNHLLPATLFLMLAQCSVRGIVQLGPRILLAFFCTTASIISAFVLVYFFMKHWLPSHGWQIFATISGSWIGGAGNMIAVKSAIDLADGPFANALITDTVCYSLWVAVLFTVVPLASRFNRFSQARELAQSFEHENTHSPSSAASLILWLGLALLVAEVCAWLAAFLPTPPGMSRNTWTILLATLAALGVSFTRLRRFAYVMPMASVMLALIVGLMASRSNFEALTQAPLFIVAGIMVLLVHGSLMLLCARLFKFDLALISITSLSHIGGPASAPLIAAAHSPALASIGVMLAMLGYIIGTAGGLLVAQILMRM